MSVAARKKLAAVRSAVDRGDCAAAVRMFSRLPNATRWSDRLGPLKARVNACGKGFGGVQTFKRTKRKRRA